MPKRPSRAAMRRTIDAFLPPSDDPHEADALPPLGSQATAADDLEHVGDRNAPANAVATSPENRNGVRNGATRPSGRNNR